MGKRKTKRDRVGRIHTVEVTSDVAEVLQTRPIDRKIARSLTGVHDNNPRTFTPPRTHPVNRKRNVTVLVSSDTKSNAEKHVIRTAASLRQWSGIQPKRAVRARKLCERNKAARRSNAFRSGKAGKNIKPNIGVRRHRC